MTWGTCSSTGPLSKDFFVCPLTTPPSLLLLTMYIQYTSGAVISHQWRVRVARGRGGAVPVHTPQVQYLRGTTAGMTSCLRNRVDEHVHVENECRRTSNKRVPERSNGTCLAGCRSSLQGFALGSWNNVRPSKARRRCNFHPNDQKITLKSPKVVRSERHRNLCDLFGSCAKRPNPHRDQLESGWRSTRARPSRFRRKSCCARRTLPFVTFRVLHCRRRPAASKAWDRVIRVSK